MQCLRLPEKLPEKEKIKKLKKVVDNLGKHAHIIHSCVTENRRNIKTNTSGCGSAWLERLVWDQEVAGSNPVTPIFMRV